MQNEISSFCLFVFFANYLRMLTFSYKHCTNTSRRKCWLQLTVRKRLEWWKESAWTPGTVHLRWDPIRASQHPTSGQRRPIWCFSLDAISIS